MGDDGRGRDLILANYYSVKALEAHLSIDSDHDLRRLLLELRSKLSTMIKLDEGEEKIDGEIKYRLASVRDTITRLHSNHTKIWDSPPAVLEYLTAVDNIQMLAKDLENMSCRMKEVVDQTHSILQTAMNRLQEELIHILARNKQCFENEYVSLPVCEEESMYNESFNSVENVSFRASTSSDTEEDLMDLVYPDLIPHITSIAGRMFASQYSHEFCLTFIKFWRHSFYEYLTDLGVERLSIAEVRKMNWTDMNCKVKKWCRAVKSFISLYLYSAKRLFDQVLGEYGNASSVCFVEASKASMLCIVDFGQAVALGPHGPEWLICLLMMYDVLSTLIPDIEILYPEVGMTVEIEFHELLARLGTSAKVVFSDFGSHIESYPSTTPFVSGGVHPLTKYVGNYMHCLSGYTDTLESLLGDRSVVTNHLLSFTSKLEINLETKSNLYNDPALKHLFLLNNVHYLVKKVRNSDIVSYFGDEWIRMHISLYRRYSISYARATWNIILSFLKVDEKVGKTDLKERCRNFAAAFEDVYRKQTGWYVSDPSLREELRILTSKTVILLYRNFVKSVADSIGEKHIKYTEQDVETYILDLLDGSSKPLNHSRQR